MIYVCIPSYDEAPTVGLLLWKIRQVFAAFPREYQLLVLDDGSSDTTAEVLEPYARVLPLGQGTLQVAGIDTVRGAEAFRFRFRLQGKTIVYSLDDVLESFVGTRD